MNALQVPALVAQRVDHLDDAAGRQQAPEGLAHRPDEPSALAGVDHQRSGVGPAAYELSALGGLQPKPSEVEALDFERAVWAAFAQLFVTFDEATLAIQRFRAGELQPA
ncbi:MAG: hypothetical protein IV107_24110 [Paucibacter sp.]|nr:hypothetical protein [Roseateles sp.]